MATPTNNDLTEYWLERLHKKAIQQELLLTPSEIRAIKRKRALRAFLKKVYKFMLTACLM